MAAIDQKLLFAANAPPVNPIRDGREAREEERREKALELEAQRARLKRKLERRKARGEGEEGEEGGDDSADEEISGEDEAQPEPEAALAAVEMELRKLAKQRAGPSSSAAAAGAEAEEESDDAVVQDVVQGVAPAKQRKKRSRVWLAFDPLTHRCKLPHPENKAKVCGAPPLPGSGTSGYIGHLEKFHALEWAHIKLTGEVKTTLDMIADAFAAKTDETKPPLGDKDSNELHRLVALWVAKCGRPQAIVEDQQLQTLLARILVLCQAKLRYELPCRNTVRTHLSLLGAEGKTLARDFLVRLLKSGVKPTISGDLWSESGMGLFGIYAHGITETWVMEKALIGLVACESKRHTAENIKVWTKEALKEIGLTAAKLLE